MDESLDRMGMGMGMGMGMKLRMGMKMRRGNRIRIWIGDGVASKLNREVTKTS